MREGIRRLIAWRRGLRVVGRALSRSDRPTCFGHVLQGWIPATAPG